MSGPVQSAQTRGGHHYGFVGPVPEEAVAVLVKPRGEGQRLLPATIDEERLEGVDDIGSVQRPLQRLSAIGDGIPLVACETDAAEGDPPVQPEARERLKACQC